MVVTVNLITDSFYLYGSYTSSSRTQNAFMHWSVYDFCSAVVFDFLYNFNGFFVCMCVCVCLFFRSVWNTGTDEKAGHNS